MRVSWVRTPSKETVDWLLRIDPDLGHVGPDPSLGQYGPGICVKNDTELGKTDADFELNPIFNFSLGQSDPEMGQVPCDPESRPGPATRSLLTRPCDQES